MNRVLLVTTFFLFTLFRIAPAQTLRTAPANPDSALQHILAALDGAQLSLRDAINSALANATSVRTAEAAYRAARGSWRKEAGAFDPSLFFTFNHIAQQLPTSSPFAGADVLTTKQNDMSGGLRMTLPIGTSIEASVSAVRLQTNSGFAFLNPEYTAFGNLSVRQPLFGFLTSNKNLSRTDKELEAAKARYDQESLAIGAQVEQNYWDLYAAERDYAVQKLTRDRAEAFLKETETRAKTGLIGPNQVANARTFRAEQEILLLDREEQLDRISDQLASLIGRRPEGGKRRWLATDDPPDEFPVEDITTLVEKAKDTNLDLRAAKADVESRRSVSSAAFWEALPKLDLVGSIGGSGLSGVPQQVVFFGSPQPLSPRSGSLGGAISQAVKRDFPSWSLGVEFSVPIGLRSGFGEEERLEAETVIAEQREIHVARLLEEQVRTSARELWNGARRLKAAKEGVEAAQEQVRIGQIEFQNGRSTAFELVRLTADFAAAQQRYSQALVRSAKAAAHLRQLTSGAYEGPTRR